MNCIEVNSITVIEIGFFFFRLYLNAFAFLGTLSITRASSLLNIRTNSCILFIHLINFMSKYDLDARLNPLVKF